MTLELPSQLVSKRIGPDVWVPCQVRYSRFYLIRHLRLNGAIDGSLERGITLPVLALWPDFLPRLPVPHWILPGRFHPRHCPLSVVFLYKARM